MTCHIYFIIDLTIYDENIKFLPKFSRYCRNLKISLFLGDYLRSLQSNDFSLYQQEKLFISFIPKAVFNSHYLINPISMKLKFYLLTCLFVLSAMFTANAQLDCNYRLEMFDSFGDGWNGASIDLSVAGTTTNYTVTNGDNNGDFNIVMIPVTDVDALTLNYTGGTFENEVSYFLYDSEDILVFSDGPFAATGLVFEGTASCPTCPSIPAESISFTPSPGGAVVTWDAAVVPGDYVVEYGPFGFTPGTGTTETVTTNSITLSGLASGEILDFYVFLDCGGGDLSGTAGPIFVQAEYTDEPLECTFVLELIAENGFGWGNSSIDVTINGVTTNYSLAFNDNDGDFLLIDLFIQTGSLITLDYTGDQFDADNLYNLLSPEGQVLFNSGADPDSGIGFQEIIFCPTCPAIDPESITVVQVPGGFDVAWAEGQLPGDYIIEYGPLGFEQGTGTFETVSTNAWSLTGQPEGDLYNFYITLDCGNEDLSFPIGPTLAQAGFTNPPAECSYTLEMIDSFGDGWNGSAVTITINGVTTEYTVTNADNNGDFLIVDIPVVNGSLIVLDYSPGTFENEVTYNLYDTDGIAVFSDGPAPQVGEGIFQGVAVCPPCPLPMQSSFIVDPIGGTTATVNWSVVSPAVSYTIEYGLNCFEQGEGTEMVVTTNFAELTDLQPSSFYSYYLTGDCGPEGLSNTAGPFFFETTPECYPPSDPAILFVDVNDASISITQNPNTTDYIIEYGPVGFVLGGGLMTAPFSGNLGIISDLEANTTYQYFVYGDCGGIASEALGPLFFTTNLPCAPITDFIVDATTDNSVDLSWTAGIATAVGYNLEFGHVGFEVGTGVLANSVDANINLAGLNNGTAYDVYITTDCDVDGTSIVAGPFSFETSYTPPAGGANGSVCTYTLEMFDSFGDGWNGANLNITNGLLDEDFTVGFADNNGDFLIVEFDVTSGQDLILNYSGGTFENEVTYFLYDSEGNLVFQDGPGPATGEVYNSLALCPPCSGISDGEVANVRAQDATISWSPSSNALSYIIEYGSVGFVIGTGTTTISTDTITTITGLTSNTWYNVFVTPDCGDIDGLGRPFGPLAFKTSLLNDVGISGFASPTNLDCISGNLDTISVLIQNFGQNPQQLIPFFYSSDFMDASITNPVDGLFTGVVTKDSSEVIDFDNALDLSAPGYYYFEAWTEMEGDENPSNDTFSYELITAYPLPLRENFNTITEAGGLADGWSSPQGVPIMFPGDGNPHGLTSTVIGGELRFNLDSVEFTTARYGPLEATSELTFDYRFVQANFAGDVNSYNMDEDDFLRVDISGDCGETYTELLNITFEDDINTILFKGVTIDLSEYANPDSAYTFRFKGSRQGSGTFFIDIDNINIDGCPENLFVQVDQSDPVSFETGNGVLFAQPTFGTPPFSFEWTNGQTTAAADNLDIAIHSVIVTDANGCTSTRDFDTGVVETATEDPIVGFESLVLAPNPTTGFSQLQVSLEDVADIKVEVFDLAGRLIQTLGQDNQLSTTFDLDLRDQANGMYLVRLQAGGAVQVMKLAVAK